MVRSRLTTQASGVGPRRLTGLLDARLRERMGEASWSLCALCPVPPEDQELHAWAVGGEAPRVSPVDVPTGSPGRGLRGAQRQTGARRQTEEVGCCREGVRIEDKHPWTPTPEAEGNTWVPRHRLSGIPSCNPHEADALL